MTVLLFAAAWERSEASDSALLVLMAIAEAADATGRATVEQRAIADRARLHISTVARAIRLLEEMGELTVETAPAGRRAATYKVKDWFDSAFAPPVRNGIPTGPHTAPEGQPGSGTAGPASECAEGPDGAEGVPPSPDKAPVPPVAGGGTPIPPGPLADFAWRARATPDTGAAVADLMPQPKRLVPSHLPPTDVGQVLAALGVKPDLRGPLYWWRAEHRDVLASLLSDLDITSVDPLIARIEEGGIRAETLNSLRDLVGMVR